MTKLKEMFMNELSDNMLVCSNNYNIMTHLYKTIHLCSYKTGLLKNIHIQEHKTNKFNKLGYIDTTFINDPELFYKLSHEMKTQYLDIFQFIYNRKYFYKININDKVYCILLYGELNKIKQNSAEHNVRLDNCSSYQTFKVIQTYNVSNNFNPFFSSSILRRIVVVISWAGKLLYGCLIK